MVEEWDIYLGKFTEGGSGSGNFGHSGRPGERGGSGDGGEVEGDSPAVQAASVAAIMADPSISYDAHEIFTPLSDGETSDPLHLNVKAFADKYKDARLERGMSIDEDGFITVDKQGNENSVKYTAAEGNLMRDNALNMHNHPECDRPFSTQDLKHYVWANPDRGVVVSKNYVFTMHKPEGGWPKKMLRDGPKQMEFKPSGREAWAVWNKFAGAYRNAATSEEKSKVWDKARRVNMVRVCKYFGIKYTQEKI